MFGDAFANDGGMRVWKVASYARLSKEDCVSGESDSIVGQKLLIEKWAQGQPEVEIVASYQDDGYSGTDFERPGFVRMMEDARKKLFDTIVVKDLSRFGRSYLDCGSWIERVLPSLGIRLYSITDGFDSMMEWDYNMALLFPMKNLMNEMYVANTSEKVRLSLKAKRERGEFVSNYAPYGYRKNPEDRHKLIVDERAALVVRRIFALKLEGRSAAEIARMLNGDGVPCPAVYRQKRDGGYTMAFAKSENPQWHAKTILRILRDESYLGMLVQGKTRRPSWRVHTGIPVPREEWCTVPDTHEAIIGQRDFDRVAEMLSASSVKRSADKSVAPGISRLICGGCKADMRRINVSSRGKRYSYFTCPTHRRDVYGCSPHSIRVDALQQELEALIGELANGKPAKKGGLDRDVVVAVSEDGHLSLVE